MIESRFGGKFVRLDPDEPMVGRCTVCHTDVRTKRSKTFKDIKSPANASVGMWIDLPYVECLVCKEQSQQVINKAGTDRKAIGTKVYVGPKPKE